MLVLVLAACSPREAPPALPSARRPPVGALARAPSGLPDLVVDCNGGADFTTIQDAIDAAPDRSWIEVRPCVYQERIDYGGKTIWISSSDGIAVTELDAQGNGAAIRAKGGEGDGTAFVGFHVEDGQGSAVDVEMSALRLQEVELVDTDGSYTIEADAADLELVDVTIDDSNQGSQYQVYSSKGSLSAKRLAVECGDGDGLNVRHNTFLVDGSSIGCAGDRAIEDEHAVGRVQRSALSGDVNILAEETHPDDRVRFWNSTLLGDVMLEFGTIELRNDVVNGQIRLTTTGDPVVLENTVFFAANCAIDGDAILTARNNDFAVGASRCVGDDLVGIDGNIAASPMFTSATDLHPLPGSPLIDAGVAESPYDDLDGTTSDIGIYGGRFTQDGGW
jgi:hypothetical protein